MIEEGQKEVNISLFKRFANSARVPFVSEISPPRNRKMEEEEGWKRKKDGRGRRI